MLGGLAWALEWQIFPDLDALQEEIIERIGADTAATLQTLTSYPSLVQAIDKVCVSERTYIRWLSQIGSSDRNAVRSGGTQYPDPKSLNSHLEHARMIMLRVIQDSRTYMGDLAASMKLASGSDKCIITLG
jgi:hypothetical protein